MSIETTSSQAKNKGDKKKPKPPKKISERYLYNSGLAYLQRFTASSAHFKTVMQRKIDRSCRHHTDQSNEECQTHLNTVTQRFIELGLIDDIGYTTGMVRSLRLRGQSARAILYKLRQKGIDSAIIIKTLKDIDNENECDDYTAALRLAKRKKIGPFCESDKSEDRQLGQFARAGYSYEISRKIMDTPRDDADEKLSLSF